MPSGSGKADTLVKLVLIFFISLLSFSVGTFVGKQFSDSQYKMAALEGEDSHRDPAAVDPSALEPTPPDALTEEDIASLEEEFSKGKTVDTDKSEHKTTVDAGHAPAAVDAHGAAPAHGTKAAAQAKKDVVKKVEKIAEVADKVAKGESPIAPAQNLEKGRQPSNALPATTAAETVGKWTVQVSSYNNEPDAVEHTKALKEKGYSAFYISGMHQGNTWYRVNVGTHSSKMEAVKSKEKLIGPDIKAAFVQKIIPQ